MLNLTAISAACILPAAVVLAPVPESPAEPAIMIIESEPTACLDMAVTPRVEPPSYYPSMCQSDVPEAQRIPDWDAATSYGRRVAHSQAPAIAYWANHDASPADCFPGMTHLRELVVEHGPVVEHEVTYVIPGYDISRFNIKLHFEDQTTEIVYVGYENAGEVATLMDFEPRSYVFRPRPVPTTHSCWSSDDD